MGNAAVEALIENKTNVMIGIINKKLAFTSFEKSIKHNKRLNMDLLNLAETLSY
jgi:6-phosphofructokinase 1